MNKITPLLIGGAFLFATACGTNVARTDANAPDSVNETIETPTAQQAREGKEETSLMQTFGQEKNATKH